MQTSLRRHSPLLFAFVAVSVGVAGAEGRLGVQGRSRSPAATDAAAPQGSAATRGSLLGGDCGVLPWFDPAPRRFETICGPLATVAPQFADVNADGVPEAFTVADQNAAAGGCIFASGCEGFAAGSGIASITLNALCDDSDPVPAEWPDALRLSRISAGTSGPVAESVSVLTIPTQVAAELLQSLPAERPACNEVPGSPRWQVQCSILGWRDCDGDRDLDLLIFAALTKHQPFMGKCDFVMSFCSVERGEYFWFENTGFEASPARPPADVNGDGTVNGADLAEVLGNWSP